MIFRDKVCVITGGAHGIGRCLCREFAQAGANVAFIDVKREAGHENEQYINNKGGSAFFFHGDIGEETVLSSFRDAVTEKFGRIDYLINNAVKSMGGIHSPCSFENFNYALHVGISAPYYLSLLFLPYFNHGGSIVNISSTRSIMSQSNTESYTAAKGGITALTHALAISLAGKVRVNSVSPGWIDTGAYYKDDYRPSHTKADTSQHPVKRIGEPMDIARAVMFLCNEENSFITGQNITVDGGMTRLMIYTGDEGWEYSG